MWSLVFIGAVTAILWAGCTEPTPTPDLEATVAAMVATQTASQPTPRATSPTFVAQPTQTSTPTLALSNIFRGVFEELNAEVVRVIDGDTVEVVLGDGSRDTVRLLGVDTPETYGQNKPYEYEDIVDTACLDNWGDLATEFAVGPLEGRTIALLLDPVAGERGSYGRLLAYILVEEQDFGSSLVAQGYARVYEEGDSSLEPEYLRLRSQAQAAGVGLWGCSSEATVIDVLPPSGGTISD